MTCVKSNNDVYVCFKFLFVGTQVSLTLINLLE